MILFNVLAVLFNLILIISKLSLLFKKLEILGQRFKASLIISLNFCVLSHFSFLNNSFFDFKLFCNDWNSFIKFVKNKLCLFSTWFYNMITLLKLTKVSEQYVLSSIILKSWGDIGVTACLISCFGIDSLINSIPTYFIKTAYIYYLMKIMH